jgi:site-specific DNA-cytosine methylase
LSVEDADFFLESLIENAKRGRLTEVQFAQSEIGSRLDAAQLMGIYQGFRVDPVGTLEALRASLTKPVVTTTPPSEAATTEETQPAPAAVVANSATEGIPIVYPLVSALRLSDDVPQFKEDADQKGVVNKLTGKFDWRDFGAIQVWQRLNGNLEVISGRHRLDLAQRSGIERVPAQIYRESDGFTAQDAAILDAELNIRDEKGTVKDYVQYFKGSGITQEEAQSRGLLDNVKGTRAFAIANFGSPELVAAHGARQLSDEAAAQIALAAPQDSRLQAVGLKVRQDGKSDEAAVNAVRAVKAIAREQNTTTDMFGFDDSLIKEAVEMAKIAERKQKELANRIAVLSKVSKNPKIAEQEGIDIKDPKAVAKRVQELKELRAAWNNWETNPDLIDEIRQERGAFELTAETEEQRAAREAEEEAARRAEAQAAAEAERKSKADSERGEFVLTGSDRPADVAEAYGQESLFGADPTVQAWSGVKTEEMPDFKDLSPDAQQNVRDLVAQGALSKDAAREIAEDDEINRASPLRQEETIKAKVGINKGRVVTLLGQQIYGVTSEMPKVTLKELFQNAFDATKEAIEKGQIQQGNILVVFNEGDRSIEVIDNGLGMPTAVMGKEFLEIAGTKKGTKRPSGSFGIAKIQFLYGNKQLEVISLRDGVLSKMNTTGNAVQAALEGRGPAPDITISRDFNEIQQAIEKYFPEGHGTSVKVLVPDSYEDSETRQTVELPFSMWQLSTDASLRLSPLFTDVNVRIARIDDVSKRDDLFDNRWRFDDVEIGSKFPTDSYAPVTSVKFPWGNAVVYTSTKPTSTNANFNVLSNGLWQFTEQIGTGPFKPLPRSFYVDVIPKKFAGEPGYPFELNRQGFTKAAEQDINAIKKYLKVLYSQTDLAEDVQDFGTIQYINNNGTLTSPADLKPTIPASKTPTLPTIKPTDKVEIKDGRMYVNGTLLPDISEQEMKDMKIDVDALTIDQSQIDPNKLLFHNNAEHKTTKDSLYKMAVDKFGEDRVNKYFYGVGKTFIRLRNALVSVDPTYADMAKEGIGISLDIKYVGVNIRVPFQGMFINPAYAKISDTPAQVAVAMMGTMQHEMAHFKQRNHGSEFASEMQRINALLETHPSFDIFALKKYFIAHMKENEDIFNFFKTEIDSGNLQPIGKRFADSSYEQIGDEGVDRSVEGAGRGREGRPGVPEGAGQGAEAAGAVQKPAGVPEAAQRAGVPLANIKPRVATSLRAQTQIPAFQQWFGDSKVVDENGEPLVVYHGTGFDFDVFEGARKGTEKAYFFAKSPELASGFALTSAAAYDGNANVMPVYLTIKNPLVIDYKGNVKWGNDRLMKQMLNQVWDGKYDGVIAKNVIDGSGEPTTIYAVIKQTQIKSAIGNVGTFSDTNRIITANIKLKPRVATWFSGARTLEAALGDVEAVMAVESDQRINEFANSVFGTAFIARNVVDVNPDEVKAVSPVLFHASPVCKNFSAAKTFRGADEGDQRSAEAVARVIAEAKPPIVTIENVPKYASTGLFQHIVKALEDNGYKWDVVIHDAADYGAAQSRKRMLLRAVREGELPDLPEKSGPSDWYKTIEDLIPDAPNSTIPPVERGRLEDMISRGQLDPSKPIITMGGSGFRGTWAAANAGGPSPTLKAANEKPRVILPDGTVKVVTPRMMARLMGLPDSYPVPDSASLAKVVLGNGIHGSVTRSLINPLLSRGSPKRGDDVVLAFIGKVAKNRRGATLGARSREETIRAYQGLKTKIGALIRKLIRAEGEKRVEQVLDIQDKLKVLDEYAKDLKSKIDATKPSRRTPEDFLARITKAYADGDISTEVFEAARAIYDKYPQLLDGLKLGIRKAPGSGIIGDFVGFARLIRLYKETEGVLEPDTIRHEVAHSMEQMMDADQRAAVIDEYTKQLKRAIEKNKDNPEAQKYFDAVLKFLANPSQATHQDAMRAMPSYDFYQYLNPSEYWAVNAEPMLKANLGNAWNRFKINMRRVFEGLKSVFGLNNKYQSHKTMRALLQGTGERISSKVLVDYIGDANAEINLANIDPNQQRRDDVDDLLNQFNRPDVPSRDTKTSLKTLLPTATRLRELYRSAQDADGRAADSLIGPLHRGLAYARNKLFFSGAGLEEADARRYGRQIVTDNDQATATLALDNMLHGGGIAVEFLYRGGIEYNPNTKRFQATVQQNNMMDVYRAEKSLKDEIGVERAEKLINGYLEAKRSRSIKDEIESLTEDIEEASDRLQDANDDLQRLLTDPSATQQSINTQTKLVDRMKAEIQGMKNQLDDITRINEEKVLMDDAEIDAFIGQENDFPQLRQIMDNWTAQNHRLLGLMRQVRLISDVRYDRLMNIKDYVPWQRVQDDDGDIHGPAPSRSITRIPKEPKFKKGKTERPIEYIIDNMTDNLLRLTMNSLRQYAAGRIVSEYATRNEKGQIKTFPKEDRDKNRFPYIIDGRRTIVEIKDPLIAEAVYGSDSIDIRMNAALEAATNFVRRAITIDPLFQVAQVVKDAPTAAIVTGVKNPVALMGRVMTSFAGTVFDTDPVADILRANGIGGFQSIARTPEKRLKQKIGIATKSVPQATLALLDHIGDASDFAARIAAYKQVMKETGNEADAINRAANVINFNRLGSSRIVRQFIRYVNFANAYLQSIDTLVTALTGRGMRGRNTKAALAVAANAMIQLTGLSLLYSFLVGGDDEYQKLDDQTKARNFFIPSTITKQLGLEKGILIPMNTSAAFFFKAFPELTYQAFVNSATKSDFDATRYRKAVAEAAADALLGPEPVPSAIRPIVEIAMDRSFFTEKSLTPRGMETLEKSRQFTDATSEIAKQLGEFGGLSPIEWDHLIRGTTGVAGMMVQQASNMIGEYLNTRPETPAEKLPSIGRFVAPEVGRGREALFYDLHERVRKATTTLKDLEKTGEIDKAEAFEKENEQLIGLSAWSNRTEAKLKKINEEIRLLSRGKEEGTAAQRRKEITELQREKSELLEGIEEIRKRDAGL